MITGIDAVQSGWLPFWTLKIATAHGTLVIGDVRDVRGPSGEARMRHAAAALPAQVRASTPSGRRHRGW